ncbi:uncharacterized protein FA14DRAFT_70291 [Meira miltonrushii]|uniref:UBA domain-containing protein n=1 Tax=Meira miltonrushii TaxID=1280837 RepID=A0A316V9R7_9BASI|nr:uncharacterized protein FA14DRAFT_70291 [Meira miltonrushii]PWN34212.1 hypothetical protein FA14DRAFT_70291 [Meira miltonrushii]
MVEMEEGVKQVVDILQCGSDEARRILQHYDGDPERAIDAYFSGTIPSTSAAAATATNDANQYQQAIVPYQAPNDNNQSVQSAPNDASTQDQPTGWDAPPSFIGPKTPPSTNNNNGNTTTSWADRASEGIRRSERNAKKRSSPIDLTGDDEDEDFRKAMQASLESESNRQKRHQEYGIGGNESKQNASGIHGVNADEEALNRAIEASMLQSSSNTRDQTPALSNSHLDSIGGKDIRSNNQPVGIVAPLPFMRIFALALQALYAAEPFRDALLAVQFTDIRITEANEQGLDDLMTDYWRGRSPANINRPAGEVWVKNAILTKEQEGIDIFMRLMTLFAFMTYTKRSLVVAEDVITHSPIRTNYSYVMNSERKPPHDILACYVQGLLDVLTNVSVDLERRSPQTCNSLAFKKTFQSFTVNAIAPLKEEDQLKSPRKPRGDPYESFVHTVMQTKTNNTIYRALYACLAEEKTLYSNPAESLFFSLGRPGLYNPNFASGWQAGGGEDAESSFKVDPFIYLDAFMFHRRNGVQLGLDPADVKQRQTRIEELEKYRKAIVMHEGEDVRSNLRASIEYFQSLCVDDGKDELRTISLNEAGPRLEAILAHLEEEVARVDSILIEKKVENERARSAILDDFEKMLEDPEYQTMKYELQAVLVDDGIDNAWAYVCQRDDNGGKDKWWRICAGEVKEAYLLDVLNEKNTINFLVYSATEETKRILAKLRSPSDEDVMALDDEPTKAGLPRRSSESNHWLLKQPLIEAIEHDNASFGRQLAGEIPISTDAQFTTQGIANSANANNGGNETGIEDEQMTIEA